MPPQLLERLIPPLVFLLLIWFGLGWLLPRLWSGLEWLGWLALLRRSREARSLREYAIRDFRMLLLKKEHGEGAARPLAVVLAILARVAELPKLQKELRRALREREAYMFKAAIENLNRGWQSGMPATILLDYVDIIEDRASEIPQSRERLQGLCAAANVRYLLGHLVEGNAAARKNWQFARKQEPETECVLKWMASYAFFNSTLFLGQFEDALKMMSSHWQKYYAKLEAENQRRLRAELSGLLTLNPILSIPRHMILAAAFNGNPLYEVDFWPSEEIYEKLQPRERGSEVRWLECWYDEAQRLCEDERISRDFSHCYAGFYYTLLIGEGEPTANLEIYAARAEEAFSRVVESSPIVSRYAKWGFYGLHHLVRGHYVDALDSLRQAAELSGVSGNRFLDCLFSCGHAVAAVHVQQHLGPEVDYYLEQARSMAGKIGRCFYFDLCEAATAEVYSARGETEEANRRIARSQIGRAGGRILGVFHREGDP